MPDFLRNDQRIQRTLPDAYSKLMLPVCGGHALWFPRKVANGGGALGDIGYIDDGAFEKLYNVYESPPPGLPGLSRPVIGMTLDEQFNMTEMKSSRRSAIELRVSGSNDIASLPLSISPVIIEPRITLQDEKFAYLIPPPPVRKHHLNLNVCDELRDWLTVHRHMLREGTIIITKVVRSSGWLGGVANGRKIEASTTVGLNLSALGRLDIGASRAYEVTQLGSIQGPDNWTKTDEADYTLIVGFVMARGRFNRLRTGQKVKAATTSAAQLQTSSQAGIVQMEISADSHPTLGAGDLETEPLDDLEAHSETEHDTSSSESSEDGDPTLLAALLDHVLLTNTDIDVAVSDSSIIDDFMTTHGTVPSPSEIIAVFATRSVLTNNNGKS
ncbi:hypothetical protein EXIGLDRAFT_767265 [Exidia glandulosa HHB12029]|uniref:Uncharacterized protein n=1 Tax=Exidia glandulosa HHB12029 TaxID=1314781 RepID=A0A166AQX3_EXIGL|nr:hypothetical protein EXIGLDRAFT_767265 [Exidia glandulosa HHB12029]